MKRSGNKWRLFKFFLVTALAGLAFSCIDSDILNISDSLEIKSSYSIPVGPVEFNINGYFESLDTVMFPWPDTISYNGVLYPNVATAVVYTSVNPFTFDFVSEPEVKVKSIEFILIISNGYPTAVSAQVYFLANGAQAPVDSILAAGPLHVEPAPLDAEGVVTEPHTVVVTVPMPTGFIQGMQEISGIVVKSRVETERSDIAIVKFYDTYGVKIHVAARIAIQYNTGDL